MVMMALLLVTVPPFSAPLLVPMFAPLLFALVVQLALARRAHTKLDQSLLPCAVFHVSKGDFKALQRGIQGARLVAALELPLAVKDLALRAPAQADGALLVPGHVRERILTEELTVVISCEAHLP